MGDQAEGRSDSQSPGFRLCGLTLFRRSGRKAGAGGAGSSGQQRTDTPPPGPAAANTKHRRGRPDSPREEGGAAGAAAFEQPLKRQHSSQMEDESLIAPASLAGGQQQPQQQLQPGPAPSSSDAPSADAAPSSGSEVQQLAGPRRFGSETKSHSFPQARRPSGGGGGADAPASPRRSGSHHHHHHHHHAGASAPLPGQQPQQQQQQQQQQQVCPPYGHKAVIGRRPKMEDAYSAVPFLLEVPISEAALDELVPPRIANHVRNAGGGSGGDAAAAASEASTATTAAAAAASAAGGQEASAGGGRPTVQLPGGAERGAGGAPSPPAMYTETLHFFGVFDGHGGADAAMHCAKTMHERVREVLSAITSPGAHAAAGVPPLSAAAPEASSTGGGGGEGPVPMGSEVGEPQDMELPSPSSPASGTGGGARSGSAAQQQQQEGGRAPSPGSEEYGDARGGEGEASSGSSGGSESSFLDCEVDGAGSINKVEGLPCTSETVEAALTKAFHMTDEDFAQAENAALVGTTAVVALVGTRMLYVANCGDSRAVLCRNGMAVALTDDHKAAREDETARVEAAGGQILFWNGVRVMGVLAVSRAIGDHCLRPFVIAQPEVTIISRHAQDELLLLASDGLWDVMNNQEACTLAKKCLQRARQRGATRAKASSIAASVLVRAAVDRGSRDNVTVVIVDLSPATAEELEAEARRTEAQHESSGMEAGGEGEPHAHRPGQRRASAPGGGGEEGGGGDAEPEGGRVRSRRTSMEAVASPFAGLPPTAPSPFEQMQLQQQPPAAAAGEEALQHERPAPDAAMLSPFGSVPLPLDESQPF